MRVDYSLIITVFLLILSGLIVIYSSTHGFETESTNKDFYKQLVWFFIGAVLVLIVVYLPLKFFFQFSYILYGLSLFFLILVLFIGPRTSGSTRWIIIKGLYNIGFQPSEFAKISTVILLARFLSLKKVSLSNLKDIIISILIVAIPILLILKEPDLSTGMVFVAFLVPVLIWEGFPFSAVLFVSILFISMLIIAIFNIYVLIGWICLISLFLFLWKRKIVLISAVIIMNLGIGVLTPIIWNKLEIYQQNRIKSFVNPNLDPRGAGYQVLQSQTAIGSGGITGKGFLKGTQTQLRFLPAQQTDFVFSVIGEEFGFIGVFCVLILFVIFLIKGINIALSAKTKFGEIIAIGFISIFVFQIFVNIGMTVGIMPVTGLPLPLISYGGSSLLSNMIMIGLLMNISMKKK